MYLKKYCETDNDEFIFCFRGHKSTSFEYKPTILRKDSFLKHEKEIQKDVINRYPDKFNSFENMTAEDLALMQHYGIPTRFLDITFNPFVALFFASEHLEKSSKIDIAGEVAVFKIPKDKVAYSQKNTLENRKEEVCLIKTAFDNPRIRIQNGGFLYFGNSGPEKIPEEWFLLKIKIQNSKKKSVREELAIMNITESTIYPELEHFRSEIERLYSK
nr:FRG domain-containing protein [Treponema sp.]